MPAASPRQIYAALLVVALMIGGSLWRFVLSIYSGSETITLTSAGGQGMGIAAISWAVTTVFVFVLGVVVVRSIF
jgi:hypothetical protein